MPHAASRVTNLPPARVLSPTAERLAAQYLKRILTARVYEVAERTAITHAKALSRRLGNTVLLKREDQQPVFSFKLRGAFNKMASLAADARARGVICASAGNHAQGVALAARHFRTRALIVMPTTTPQLKRDAVKSLDGEVVLHGDSYSDAYAHALTLAEERGLSFVHPFDDPAVIAGQGTVGMEILQDHEGPLDAVFVAVGGGGLIAGVAAYIKSLRPDVRVIGVQTEDSAAMQRSVAAGRRLMLSDVGLFSDGTAVKQVGAETFKLARALVDDFVRVDTDEVCAAIKDVFQDTRSVLEPAGALGVAAIKRYVEQHGLRGHTLMTVTCGANMNFDRLRFVAERAEFGEHREALFAVTIPEQPGAFRRLCELIGRRAVTEFNYRIGDARQAHVFVGLAIGGLEEAARLARSFERHGFATLDLTGDELAKEHVRHMVGGKSPLAGAERLFRFEFPERPGALMRFLSTLQPEWNISLFHYRNQGGDAGRVLAGLQLPPGSDAALARFLAELTYPVVEETAHPVAALFLR
jgi:threonine dehydratase